MLRTLLIGLGAAGILAGIGLVITGSWTGISLLAGGAILLIGTVFERVRYKKPIPHRPGQGWEPTSERFIDDETGKTITVWIEPKTGERTYVED